MIQKIGILTTVVCTFVLFACSDPQAEAEIASLTQQKQALTAQIEQLQHMLDSVSAHTDSLHKSLSDLDMVK